jgi:hypothetical protein
MGLERMNLIHIAQVDGAPTVTIEDVVREYEVRVALASCRSEALGGLASMFDAFYVTQFGRRRWVPSGDN